jgi:hypothetical protein
MDLPTKTLFFGTRLFQRQMTDFYRVLHVGVTFLNSNCVTPTELSRGCTSLRDLDCSAWVSPTLLTLSVTPLHRQRLHFNGHVIVTKN